MSLKREEILQESRTEGDMVVRVVCHTNSAARALLSVAILADFAAFAKDV